ncbi:TonB-dependent receptor domain-containing protein [Roseomonas sp. 18066]|uniref:TonB-dependent receptor domain-containing protein n=1 Tax=Roseomonas sp. 18066 TaxID=2681412 RepID=UPI00135A0660|nr:TonB-dependent receptor [Roseomonas sp. 18066]
MPAPHPTILRHMLTTTALCALGVAPALAQDAGVQLAPVAAEASAADAPYQTPAAVSRVAPEDLREGADTNRLLDMVPGAALGGYASQPGVAVNIRGFEGVGRVNMMVEGVRQNFRPAGHEGGSFAYIDPSFLGGIDIERGAVTGPGGMGALVGAVNFRLLDVEDILRPGRTVGGRAQAMTGTNGYRWNSSLVSAARLGNGVSILGGISGRENGNFRNGDGQEVEHTGQALRSGLFRLNWEPDGEHRFSFLGNIYANEFTSNYYNQTIQSNLAKISYRYNPAANPLVDLNVSASWNQVRMMNHLTELGTVSATATGRRIINEAYEVGLSNTSRFTLGEVGVAWDYGAQYATDDTETRRGGVNGNGRLSIAGAYSNAGFTLGRLSFVQGLRYDHYENDAEGYATTAYGAVPVTGPFHADRSEGRVSPKFTLAYQLLDWLQPYVSYGWAFRPPTISETMYSGPHSVGGTSTFYPNPYLGAERSRGWELGLNLLRRDVLMADDRLRMKVAYYDNDVEDLVNTVTVRGTNPTTNRAVSYYFYDNVPGTSRVSGIEVEGGYDMGLAYVNLAYNGASIKYPDGADHSYTPRSSVTLDAGIRLLDRRVTLGGKLRRIGATQTYSTTGTSTPLAAYTTVDLYGSWRAMENLNLFASATNVGNTSFTVPTAETIGGGRGRTIIGGLTFTF